MYDYNLFLSCDWGTSSFRLRLVETKTAAILYELHTSEGIKDFYSEYFYRPNKKEEKIRFYQKFLLKKIVELEEKANSSFKYIPLILSGMASSSIGIEELPYAVLPFDLRDSALPCKRFDSSSAFPYDMILISGIRSEMDVMRGEETQLLGLANLFNIENCTVIIPGTHSKHIKVNAFKIEDIRTYMTGEVFSLMSKYSILRDSLSKASENIDLLAFQKGVEKGSKHGLLNVMFHVRSQTLLQKNDKISNADLLSGMIIGSELRDLLSTEPGKLFLCGEGKLQSLYKSALDIMDLDTELVTLGMEEVKSLVIRGQMEFMQQLV